MEAHAVIADVRWGEVQVDTDRKMGGWRRCDGNVVSRIYNPTMN